MNIKKNLDKSLEYFNANQLDRAAEELLKILKKYPNHKEALSNFGLVQIRKGNKIEGKRLLERSLSIEFNNQIAYNLVLVLLELQLWDEAEKYNNQILTNDRQPNHKYKFTQAIIYRGQREYKKALKIYDEILFKNPNLIDAHVGKGFVYNILQEYPEAIKCYKQALSIDSNYYPAIYNLGITLNNNQDSVEAVPYLEKSCQMNLNNVDGWLTLAAAEIKNNNLEKATKYIHYAADLDKKINPIGSAAAVFQQALLEMAKNNWENSISYLNKVLALDPNHIEAKYHMGLTYLHLGYYTKAHDYYKYRSHRQKDVGKYGRYNDVDLPAINQNTMLIVAAEQGLGDQIVALRLLPFLAKKVKKLIYVSYDKLKNFVENNFSEFEVIGEQELINNDRGKYKDYLKINLFSIFKYLEDIDLLKAQIKTLKADAKKINKYYDVYRKDNNKKLIGLSWKSKNERVGKRKSINLLDFKNLLELHNEHNFINLQYGDVDKEIEELNISGKSKLMNDTDLDYFNDIDGLAGLILNCDLVITVSNLTAHIAGSLGVKTLLLLPKVHGKFWYWDEKTEISTWYKSVKIIVQDEDYNWKSVIDKLNQEIANFSRAKQN